MSITQIYALLIISFSLITMIYLIAYLYFNTRSKNKFEKLSTDLYENAVKNYEKLPDKAKPAWDIAQSTLNSYYDKNLKQISSIYFLTIFVMLAGFVIIIWGISQSIISNSSSLPAIIAAVSGVITEFIGATFLLIYKSTITQASNNIANLSKVNNVGIAMQILDTISDTANKDSIKDVTKMEVVKILMTQNTQTTEEKETK